MVGLQNKVKPPNVQHVSEPDGMIDIDLKTTIDNVIEINKKKLYKRRSCYKKLLYAIPIGILVTTSALLLIRTYLSNTLNKQDSVEHDTLPTFEYSEINFGEEGNLNLNNNNNFKVKRDIKRYNPDDAFIPLKSTPTNFDSNELHTSSTPSSLHDLSFYKENGIKKFPNDLSNNDNKNLAKTVTPSTNQWKESTTHLTISGETHSISNSNIDKLSTEIHQLLSESKSPSFDTTQISMKKKIDFDQPTTDTLESVTLPNYKGIPQFSTSKFDTITSHADNLKIENLMTTIPDENQSTIIDFSTKTTSDGTISPLVTPKSNQIELSENDIHKIHVKLTSLNENHLDEHNELNGINHDNKNLPKAVLSSLPNTYFKQSKDNIDLISKLNAKIDQFFAVSTAFQENPSSKSSSTETPYSDQFTSDSLEEVTFADSGSFTQFSASKSDNIVLHSKGLKPETSSYIPDKNESTMSIGSQKNLSEQLKYELPIPFNHEFHHSSQKPEIPTTLFNLTDLTEPIADIALIDKTSHFDDEASTQFGTLISEQTEIIKMTTKFSNDIHANQITADVDLDEVNTINLKTEPYTKSTEILEANFQTESTVDLINQFTATNEENVTLQTNVVNQTPSLLPENFEDNNDSSTSNLNATTRNVELSKRISNSSNDLGKNRRATTANQQVFSNNNNQFQLSPMNNWQPQEFQNFEVEKTKAKDAMSSGLQIPINQQIPIPNQNYPLTVCPSGVKILQQSNANPYYYNVPSLYQNILPLSSPAYNPYMNPQNPYQGGGNLPQFYNNQPLQLSGYQPNNFYRDNTLSNGQYYICSSLSGNPYIQSSPEIRKRNEFILQKTNSNADVKNGTRWAGECPFGEFRCIDGSKCIKRNQYCDNAVNCADMSDELECSCISRIEKSRMCDGYLDCPDGEDESKCFGCDEDNFNCDDWTPQDRFSTCIPMEQRCDGVVNCPNRKDEEKCSVLTEYFSTEQNFLVTYAKGYLYRNFGGKWFPVCRNPEKWANDACQIDGGGSYMSPLTHLIQTNINYRGPYVSMSPRGQLNFDNTCSTNSAVFVECPLLVCGTRIKTRNYYRSEEVDTSAERILTQSLNFDHNEKNLTDSDEDAILGNSRVVGGKPSQPESWPWIVSIYRNGVFHCGGVLINEFWIVTAAHCVDKYWHYYFEVQAGLLRRYSYSPIVQTRVASHIISHQSYDKMKLKNDIALINLENPVRYNRYVRPICLPSEITAGQNFMRNPQPNTICSAIGWGATSEHGSDPDHLREVDVPVLKNCKYKEDREGHEICAGLREGGKDACQGDSGGPFLCQNPNVANQWYLAGIVSHGEGCARPNEPGVYTRVSLYLEWIHDNIRSNVQQRMQPLNHCPGYTCKDTKRCIPKQRHCDKIIDCLYADDEIDCDRSHFTDIFKHAIIDNLLPRTNSEKSPNSKDIIWDEDQIEHDNKDKPDHILGETQNSDISSELFETIAINNSFIENDIENNVKSPFLCQRMLQTIDITKRCDKVPDCEDATDEQNCTCVDYLTYSHPKAVCDGVIDCFDASDEQNCPPKCRSNEFYCYLSNACIPSYRQCDGKKQCPSGEDERNCFALTDLKDIMLDVDSRPVLKNDGFVSFYHNGTWEIVCGNWNTTEGAQYATQICIYLGFHDYKIFYKVSVPNKPLTVIQNRKAFASPETSVSNNKCTGIKVGCSDTIDVTHEVDVILKQSFDHFEFIPWNAEIYMNGKYKCSGALLEKDWVITTKTCFGINFRLHSNYVAVLLGGRSKMYLNVKNVFEQVLRVVEYIAVNASDISLLRLERKAVVSNYIRPLGLNVKQYNLNEKQLCVVVGRNASNKTELMYLKSRDSCTSGFRCFMKDNEFNSSSCKDESNTFWGGCVVCRSKRGWYPASVFFSHFGSCWKENEMWSSIQYWKPNILQLMEQTPFSVDPAPCKGFRCNLGECINNYQVCDGIPHCRDGKDEELNYCTKKFKNCNATQSCECKPSELKCKNGKCVEKFRFCDRVNDCEDWSDEPVKCDCRSYLEVTNPEKLCDGVRNCRDRTDEDPFVCKCSQDKFRCQQSNLCVSQEVVCDQISDCPNGEDESYCIELVGSEVQVRTAGLWHPGCFSEHLTTLKLEDICEHVGFVGSSALRNNTVKKTSGLPVMDPFIGIVVNRIDDQPLIIAKRDGDKPYITFREDANCYRLFLNCL